METQRRHTQMNNDAMQSGDPSGAGGPSLQDIQAAGQQFLQAGNDAINRALSGGRSDQFLAANRQSGGQ